MARASRTAAFRKDLYEIWLHVADDSIDAADELIDSIEEQIALLSDFPGMGRQREDLLPNLRSLPIRNYLIFYRPAARRGIHLVRIVHGARDLKKIFRPRK